MALNWIVDILYVIDIQINEICGELGGGIANTVQCKLYNPDC